MGQDIREMPSGATLVLSVASWESIKALHDAVLREVKKGDVSGIDVEAVQGVLEGKIEAGAALIDRAISLASSKAVEDAMFRCAEKAVYKTGDDETSRKVTRALFDDLAVRDQTREDYYAIAYAVAEVNLRPFVKALSTSLRALMERYATTRGSPVPSATPSASPSSSPERVTAAETPSGS